MTTYRPAAPDGLEFGDVCTGPFLADIRVDRDTLPVFQVPDPEKLLTFTAYRESTRRPNRLVVTSGEVVDRAIVVSDTCAVEAALGRGERRARGRIWLAPLRRLEAKGALKEVEDTPDAFGRLLLRPDDATQSHWAVELQRTFPADAASVRRALEVDREGFLLQGLDTEVADDLRARWAAVTARCGPLVARINASHLVDRLEARGVATVDAETAASAVVAVAAANWVFEGGSLEATGALREGEAGDILDATVDGMIDDLTTLRDKVLAALEALALSRERL
jgi:hypothetical protein